MGSPKNSNNQILTIPKELSEFSKNVKFAYIALRNLFYALHKCSVNAGIKGQDFTAQTSSLISSYIGSLNQNKINLFKNDIEATVFADTLTAFDRNMINKNEQIAILYKTLSSTPKVDKHQIFMLFCHVCVECSLQLGNIKQLNKQLILEVLNQTEEKMLINLGNNIENFIKTEILSIYNSIN